MPTRRITSLYWADTTPGAQGERQKGRKAERQKGRELVKYEAGKSVGKGTAPPNTKEHQKPAF
jgi:hypothetical protein